MLNKPKMEPWMTGYEPLGSDCLVIPMKEGTRESPGGIVMPERSATSNRQQIKGFVFAAGPGEFNGGELIPNPVEIGDVILFCPAADFQEITDEGHTFWQVGVRDVITKCREVVDEAPPGAVD